jgi:predicted TIM-barrel fold metal-dependent hydrolase
MTLAAPQRKKLMIINVHDHPYDPKTAQASAPYYEKFATERHLLDGTPIDRAGMVMTPEQTIEEMDAAGVDKTVILNAGSNNHIYKLYLKPHSERFIGFTSSSPLMMSSTLLTNGAFNQANWENTRHCLKDLGFTGIKLLPAYGHYSPVDPRVYPYYALAAELDVPITLHMGMTPVRHAALRFGRPIDVDRTLFEFPTLRLNVSHLGWPWEDELLGLMVRSPNLYTDISYIGELGLKRVARNLITARDYGVLSRVMFGTDPLCRPLKFYIDWVKNGLNEFVAKQDEKFFTDEEINGLLGGNALKFLGINPEAALA